MIFSLFDLENHVPMNKIDFCLLKIANINGIFSVFSFSYQSTDWPSQVSITQDKVFDLLASFKRPKP